MSKIIHLIDRHPENKWILLIVSILFICSLFASKAIVDRIAQLYRYVRYERFLSISKKDTLLILPIVCYCLYLACSLPLSYDESFTLKYFTNRGFFHSLTNYPATNNHVLHTLFTTITYPLIPVSNAISLRLPAIIFTILSLILAKNELQKQPGTFFLFGLLLVFSFGYIEYSFQARGYSMQVFFALGSYALYTRSTHFIERWYLLLFVTVLGLYTSPSYLYIALPVVLMFVWKNFREISISFKECTLSSIFGLCLIITLYAPIVLKSGYAVILSNQTVRPLDKVSFIDVLKHVRITFDWFVFGNWGMILLAVFIALAVVRKNFLLLLLVIIPAIMMLSLKQLPFPRIFTPLYLISIVFICQNLPYTLLEKTGISNIFLTTLLLATACCISMYGYQNSKNRGDINTAFEMQRLQQKCNINELGVSTNVSWYFKTTYEGYCLIHKTSKNYIETDSVQHQSHNPRYLLTTAKSLTPPLDSFMFIVPHYLIQSGEIRN